ncbi:tRNA 2'-phosphotransferase [Polyrhizophydium stewartii]|uniref:2'-phosphotransferase n=1 Tax=Polyrhizophydium stewartii TaxID=2732419 RepID=A0ABR4MXD6_9FUNG
MRPDGFVAVDDVLALRDFKGVSFDDVRAVVRDNDKQRFAMRQEPDGTWLIRANQGHSIAVQVEMETITDPADVPVAVHGTYKAKLDAILAQGLKVMSRQHIHLAVGLIGQDGVISGMRRDNNVVIYVDVAKAMADGIVFMRSANNVILTEGRGGVLLPEYFSRVVDRNGKSLITPAS